MLLKVKIMPKGDICMIDNGKSYVFDRIGSLKLEDAGLLPQYTSGALALPVVSMLSSGNSVELCLFNNNGCDMKRYTTDMASMDCVLKLQMLRKFTRMLKKSGIQDEVRYNQMIYVYPDGTSLDFVVSELCLKEIG